MNVDRILTRLATMREAIVYRAARGIYSGKPEHFKRDLQDLTEIEDQLVEHEPNALRTDTAVLAKSGQVCFLRANDIGEIEFVAGTPIAQGLVNVVKTTYAQYNPLATSQNFASTINFLFVECAVDLHRPPKKRRAKQTEEQGAAAP